MRPQVIHEKNSISTVDPLKGHHRHEIMKKRVTYGSCICISITNKCNIQCRHCIASCGPANREVMPFSSIEKIINDAKSIKINKICLTGGEPFLELPLLVDISQACNCIGIKVTVITNGYWASSVKESKRILSKIKGLAWLGLSTDVFHQEFIGIEKIKNAIIAAKELSIESAIRISYLNDPLSEIERIRQSLIDVAGFYTIEYQPVQLIGRAVEMVNSNDIFKIDTTNLFCRGADIPSICSNGNVSACCGPTIDWPTGHPLELGNINNDSICNILNRADMNPLIHFLRLWGPRKLLETIKYRKTNEDDLLDAYSIKNMCDLCRYLNTDMSIANKINAAIYSAEILNKISITRAVELGEISMLPKK
jgi:MoaA/NifB/PqqE/SkfB family radical SAM enzyme